MAMELDENNNEKSAYFKIKTIKNNKESASICYIELEDKTTIAQQLPFQVVISFG